MHQQITTSERKFVFCFCCSFLLFRSIQRQRAGCVRAHTHQRRTNIPQTIKKENEKKRIEESREAQLGNRLKRVLLEARSLCNANTDCICHYSTAVPWLWLCAVDCFQTLDWYAQNWPIELELVRTQSWRRSEHDYEHIRNMCEKTRFSKIESARLLKLILENRKYAFCFYGGVFICITVFEIICFVFFFLIF